jgi:hypothetical protein
VSSTTSEYIQLGLDLVSLEDNPSRMPNKPSMVAEKKNDGAEYCINLLLEEKTNLNRERTHFLPGYSFC